MKQVRVQQGKDGVWFSRPYLGVNVVTGKPLRPYKRFPKAKNEAEAQAMAQEWVNTLAIASDMHVSMRLVDMLYAYVDYLEGLNKPANTVKTYRSSVRAYIEPNVGELAVDEVRPYMVDTLYSVVMARGGKFGKPVSPNTVIKLHWFLRGAFKYFAANGIVDANPIAAVQKPDRVATEVEPFNEAEFATLCRKFDEALRAPAEGEHEVFVRNATFAAYQALMTGERVGEICGNSRSDAQMMRKLVHVGHTVAEKKGVGPVREPKTKGKKSRNVSVSDAYVENLRNHYEWQRGYLENVAFSDRNTMICCTKSQKIVRPSRVSAVFSEICESLGFPKGAKFHTLRHTHATYLLFNGANMKDIQERLGHANITTTLQLYSHILPGRDAQAAGIFSDVVDGITGGEW